MKPRKIEVMTPTDLRIVWAEGGAFEVFHPVGEKGSFTILQEMLAEEHASRVEASGAARCAGALALGLLGEWFPGMRVVRDEGENVRCYLGISGRERRGLGCVCVGADDEVGLEVVTAGGCRVRWREKAGFEVCSGGMLKADGEALMERAFNDAHAELLGLAEGDGLAAARAVVREMLPGAMVTR